MKRAVIDLGTNTFHLQIIGDEDKTLFKLSKPAKIGMGGINKGIITEEGIQRGIAVLRVFKEHIIEFGITSECVFAFGTSAFRSAKNKEEVLNRIHEATQIHIEVISGDREAELIYVGVTKAVEIKKPSLIVDIGGGSVEFIICKSDAILWKKSIEIGGQRMMEFFQDSDPLSAGSVNKLDDYLRENLLPLANACHQYSPSILVGSSGSFDTLNSIYFYKKTGKETPEEEIGFNYPLEEFIDSYEKLLSKNRVERMAIPGMIELRVDMIVVAVCLVRYLIQNFGLKTLKISKYALKEGILDATKGYK
ncbi:MAG: exopolyphosphatase/guanosine-5'-triphosphate,3'-diphosphate pyrophosphatase [Arcticibacterium sp.]|jgi:exopolyphosphatase/guanosine-5'-triphosphate,3'-diphosphate pyrophosphatase